MSLRSAFPRRKFLQRGVAAVGAAIAAPLVVSSSALGKDGAVAPSERIGMGFIGLGHQGGGHYAGGAWTYLPGGYLGRPDVQALAVCDVRKARRQWAQQAAEERYSARLGKGAYQACEAYIDFRDVLARKDIDAVLIATPIHWHALMTIMAARAGKDVYCEKPTALTLAESRAAVDAVERYGRVFQAGTQQRSEYEGKFRRACQLVRSGRIGKLKEVYAYHGGGGFSPGGKPGKASLPVPDDLDWDLWLGPAPWQPYDGNANAHRFGWGDINWGQHHYDIVQWGMGADNTGPVEISQSGGHPEYRYANGVVVHGCVPPGEGWADGGARFIGTEGQVTVHRSVFVTDPPELARLQLGPHEGNTYYSDSHSGNFLQCIRTRQPTICNVQSTHRAISLHLLGGLSTMLNRTLKWNSDSEHFIDDAEADRMLSVAPREPWRI